MAAITFSDHAAAQGRYALVIHGGAGTLKRSILTPEQETAYRSDLESAVRAGETILKAGGSSLDAVTAAIRVMEDSPLFNAGKGAVFNHEGKNELDASIMDGKTGGAGAVAGITRVKNPILAARAVMEHSPHVLLTSAGADAFAEDQGLELVEPSYFYVQSRWNQLIAAREKGEILLDHSEEDKAGGNDLVAKGVDDKYGTVGAVALDIHGNLAAATSTGGLTNKFYGRTGDSPIIGAGTYADNTTAAVSCTGVGEYFIRGAVAYDITARMKYLSTPLDKAVAATLNAAVAEKGGHGGIIAVDKDGNIAFDFNTEGMYRGYVKQGDPITVGIYR